MQTAKQDALAAIASMPDDARMEDIQYRLYVLEQIRTGVAELDAGKGIPHDEAMAQLAEWRDD